jgi:hypothetical protein
MWAGSWKFRDLSPALGEARLEGLGGGVGGVRVQYLRTCYDTSRKLSREWWIPRKEGLGTPQGAAPLTQEPHKVGVLPWRSSASSLHNLRRLAFRQSCTDNAPAATGRTPGSRAPAQPPSREGSRVCRRPARAARGSTGRDKTGRHSTAQDAGVPSAGPAPPCSGDPGRTAQRELQGAAVPQQRQHGTGQVRTA